MFPYNFPLMGTYWTAADILVQHVAKLNGGFDKLKGKKITLVYHDSPYGKEPIALLTERSKLHGFELATDPGHASRSRAKSGVVADSSEPSRLCLPVGLGRDDLDRVARSGGDRLSA